MMVRAGPVIAGGGRYRLHIIVTRQMSQAYKATMDKFVGAAFGSGALRQCSLSGEKQTSSSEFKVKRRPLARHFVSPDGKE